MKIDAMSGYPVFRKNNNSAGAKAAPAAERAGKTDVADFSRTLASALDKNLTGVKSGVLMDAAKPAPAQELAALKESVREGSYHRSTDEIVNAILGNIL